MHVLGSWSTWRQHVNSTQKASSGGKMTVLDTQHHVAHSKLTTDTHTQKNQNAVNVQFLFAFTTRPLSAAQRGRFGHMLSSQLTFA